MPFNPDPLLIYLKHDPELPDWQLAAKTLKAFPGVCVVERLSLSEKIGSLYIPDRAHYTYYEDDDPVAGFEPSVGVVLAAGLGVPLFPGQVVIIRDGDGLEFEDFEAGPYKSKNPVLFFGRVVPEGEDEQPPGYIEDMPYEECISGVVEGMDIKQMLGKNILLERDEDDVSRKTDSGIHLPDVVSENAASEATVKMVGDDVKGCKAGDRVIYHPLACLDFYDPENKRLRVVREMAILSVVEPVMA